MNRNIQGDFQICISAPLKTTKKHSYELSQKLFPNLLMCSTNLLSVCLCVRACVRVCVCVCVSNGIGSHSGLRLSCISLLSNYYHCLNNSHTIFRISMANFSLQKLPWSKSSSFFSQKPKSAELPLCWNMSFD